MGVANEGDASTPAAMTLALAPSSSAAEQELCTDLSGGTERERSMLYVAVTRGAMARLDSLPGTTGDGTTTVLRLGGGSASASSLPAGVDGNDTEVRSVGDPTNLTRLGIAFTEWLAATDDTTPVVCIHSLDALLQYVATDRLFRFLSVLSDHLQEAGAVAHVHADPSACEESALAALRPLFTEVVEYDEPQVVE